MPDITTLFEGTDGVSRTLFNQKLSDVNAHGNDTTSHVTEKDREVWNKKANGNNAVWVATSVFTYETDWTAVFLTIPNFVFTEGCQVTFKISRTADANALSAEAFRVLVDGRFYVIRTHTHESIDQTEIKAGAIMTVMLSSSPPISGWGSTDNSVGTAFFKGGSGSIKEMYDFPLSIQTAEPTPVNTNHIWIQNDAKMLFAIDEAIRAVDWNGNNMYYAIVDNTDNNQIFIATPKTTTDGVTFEFVNRHMPKDNAPWTLGWDIPFAKKHGISYWSSATSKWPRIMSRVNGVIDVENAKRWDGSSWQWLSQKGHYLFNNYTVMNRTESNLSNERVYNYAGNLYGGFPAVTLDGLYMAVANNSSEVSIYLRTGDTFTLNTSYPTAATTANNISHRSIAFSPDGQYLAIPGIASNSGSWTTTILKKQSKGTWAKLTDVKNGGTTVGAGWSTDGSKLVTLEKASDTPSSYWKPHIYNRSGDTFSLLKIAAGYEFVAEVYPRVFMVGNIVVVGCVDYNGRSYVIIFNIANDSYSKISLGTYLNTVKSMEYVSGNMFITHDNSGQLIMLDVSLGSAALKHTINVYDTITSLAITQDKKLLFVKTDGGLKVYSVDVNSGFTYIGTTTIMNNGDNDRLACL